MLEGEEWRNTGGVGRTNIYNLYGEEEFYTISISLTFIPLIPCYLLNESKTFSDGD